MTMSGTRPGDCHRGRSKIDLLAAEIRRIQVTKRLLVETIDEIKTAFDDIKRVARVRSCIAAYCLKSLISCPVSRFARRISVGEDCRTGNSPTRIGITDDLLTRRCGIAGGVYDHVQ